MARARIAGILLLVLLGAGVLIRVTNRAGVPPKNPVSAPVEIRTDQSQPVTETVDLRNGNLHVGSSKERAARVARPFAFFAKAGDVPRSQTESSSTSSLSPCCDPFAIR